MNQRPLADEIRPQTLDEVVGQRHILGKNGVLRRIIESGQVPNLVFYGPSGTGKTTVANIIANTTLHRLNATTATIGDIREVIADVDTLMAPNGVLLYLDEIQYFNKKQQQSLLEFMENGKITVIASTTENPYFYIYNAILSRSTVFEFRPISPEAALRAVLAPHLARPTDAIVLGCTHYLFLRRALERIAPGIPLVDGNLGTVRQLRHVLEERGLLRAAGAGGCELHTTGDAKHFLPLMQRLLRA